MSYKGEWWGPAAATAWLDCNSTQPGQNKHLPHSLLCWHDMNVCVGAGGVCGLQAVTCVPQVSSCMYICVYVSVYVCLLNQLGQFKPSSFWITSLSSSTFPVTSKSATPALCVGSQSLRQLGSCPLKIPVAQSRILSAKGKNKGKNKQ